MNLQPDSIFRRTGGGHKTYCCVSSCRHSTKDQFTFFNLPTEKERRRQWLIDIGREDLLTPNSFGRNRVVCEVHFAPYAIKQTNARKLLGPYAMPTLLLPKKSIIEVMSEPINNFVRNVSTQTPINQDWQIKLETDILTKKRFKRPSQTEVPKEIRKALENESKIVLSSSLIELLMCDGKLNASKIIVQKEDRYRDYCLNLYYGSTQGYRLLQNALCLPNPTKLIMDIPITTEINDTLLRALNSKVENMSHEESYCTLVVDSMPLTPHLNYNDITDRIVGFHEVSGSQMPLVAERALVLMINGMSNKWKQVAGYALLSNTGANSLAHWLNEVLNKLITLGLQIYILSFASKVEADFFETRWVSNDTPYFFIKKNKIYCISDPKMLLNTLLNDWRLYDIHYKDKRIAKFEHIEQFYKRDKDSKYRFAPNLTDDHFHPTNPDNNDYAELFSTAVASGLSAYIDSGAIDDSAKDTVQFINIICELHSFFVSANNLYSSNKTFSDNSSHGKYLTDMKDFFIKLKLFDSFQQNVTKYATFTRFFIINISTYSCLLNEKKIVPAINKSKSNEVPLHSINHGSTEELFNQIRSRSNTLKPTAEQFEEAFRQLYILHAVKPLKKRDTKYYHTNFFFISKKMTARQAAAETQRLNKSLTDPKDNESSNDDGIVFSNLDYNHIDRAERHTLIYVAGFLLKKCKEYHRYCDIFHDYTDINNKLLTINHKSRYYCYSQKKKISFIAAPNNHFVIIVEKIEEVFRKQFKRHHLNKKCGEVMYNVLKGADIARTPPCPCFPWAYLIKLFIRMRIAYMINLNNREIGRAQKQFVIPLLLSEY